MAKTEYLLHKELEHVLALLTRENQLVCRVMLHTGLRVGDVLALRTEQLKPTFWVKESKTGKSKKIGIPEPLLSQIKSQAGLIWAFEGRNCPSKHRTRQAVWHDVKRAAKACRLPQNIAPHSLRKVYAVDLRRKYGDLDKVQRALNHSNPTVTLLYAMADQLLSVKGHKGPRR